MGYGEGNTVVKQKAQLPLQLKALLRSEAAGTEIEIFNALSVRVYNKELKNFTGSSRLAGVKEGFKTGRGRVIVRAKSTFETLKTGRERIIFTEIPYQVNKASCIIKMYELVGEKKIEGISEVRDESDRDGMRVVVELKKDAIPNVVLNQLYQYTPLQSSFSINNIALDHGRPKLMNLLDMTRSFVEFRPREEI